METIIQKLKENGQVGFIIPKDTVYEDCILKIIESLKEMKLSPFFGAGISISPPSCVPSADNVNKRIKRLLWNSFKKIIEKDDWFSHKDELNKIARLLIKTRMERLFDVLHKAYGLEGLEGIKALNGEKPNFNHECIALLSKHSYLQYCITLNFDVLIEKACIGYQTICPLYSTEPIFSINNGLTIIKPHGSFNNNEENEELKYIQLTIDQAGDIERDENVEIIKKVLSESDVLLVAGYSDNDWDIFPIIQDYLYDHPELRLIWVQYENETNVSRAEERSLKQIDKVLKWLLKQNNKNHSILIGDISILLEDVLKKLDIPVKRPQNNKWDNWANKVIDKYISILNSNQNKLLLAFSYLIGTQTERFFQREIISKLEKTAKTNHDNNLLIECYWTLAGSYHMESKYDKSLELRKLAIKFEESKEEINYKQLSDKYMWIGYNFYCLCKRPRISPKGLILLLYNYKEGKQFMKKAIELENKYNTVNDSFRKISLVKERSNYYELDMYHTWGNLLLFLGPRFKFIIKRIYCWIDKRYVKLFKEFPNLAYTEYYWMRYIEAKILSNRLSKESSEFKNIHLKLNKIENSCSLTFKQIHLGNVYLYRGMLNESKENIKNALLKTENHWRGDTDENNRIHTGYGKFYSGLRHVVLFKRYYGFLSFRESIKVFNEYMNK